MSEIDTELRARVETQANLIQVALGYLRAGKPDIAALILATDEETAHKRWVAKIMAAFDGVIQSLKNERGEG